MAVRQPELPPPTSGLLVEVNFRRFLQCCERIVAGDCLGRTDLCDWQRSPTFHQYVDTLQELLADLQGSSSRRCPRALLKAYEQRVDHIGSKLLPQQLPSYCQSVLSPQHQQAGPAASAAPPTAASAGPASPSSRQGELAQMRHRSAASGPQLILQDATKAQIERQLDMQDDLTEELVSLAAGLKRNAAAMQAAVSSRGRLLEDADVALEANLAAAKRSSKESQIVRRKGSRSFWFTLLLLFTVSMVFVAMYMFIKVTSMAGYRRVAIHR